MRNPATPFAAVIARFGGVDGLVNSAGIRGVGTLLDIDRALWQRNLAVNLEGTLRPSPEKLRLFSTQKNPYKTESPFQGI